MGVSFICYRTSSTGYIFVHRECLESTNKKNMESLIDYMSTKLRKEIYCK